MLKLILLSLFLCAVSSTFAQVKYEREYRISEEEVPDQALSFIQQYAFDKKVKWYREEGLNDWTIEAKSKLKGKLFSIEFDSLGQLQDTEIKVSWEEIPEETRTLIESDLKAQFQKHRLRRIQAHYNASFGDLVDSPDYEIVAKCKGENGYQLMELLYSSEGKLLRKDRILLRNTDNLEY